VSSRAYRKICWPLLPLLAGCAADLALAGGVAIPQTDPGATRAAWSGELRGTLQGAGSVETGIWLVDHLTLGFELQGRAAQHEGVLYTGGGSLGLAFSQRAYMTFAQFDGGTPLGWGARATGYYVGGSAGWLWALSPRSELSGPNETFHLLEQRNYVGPLLRYRRQDLMEQGGRGAFLLQHDLVLGLQIRILFASDLF
jgi:hypothetical protein